jgi:hypothetical protein
MVVAILLGSAPKRHHVGDYEMLLAGRVLMKTRKKKIRCGIAGEDVVILEMVSLGSGLGMTRYEVETWRGRLTGSWEESFAVAPALVKA